MSIFTRMAFSGVVQTANLGVGIWRWNKDRPPPMEDLKKIVERARRLDEPTKLELQGLIEAGDRKGLAARLSELKDEGKLYASGLRRNYSPDDVRNMKQATGAELDHVNAQLLKLDALIPKKVDSKTLDDLQKNVSGFLAKLDAKYLAVPAEVIRARLKEIVVASYLKTHHSNKDLALLGFSGEQLEKAKAIRDRLVLEAKAHAVKDAQEKLSDGGGVKSAASKLKVKLGPEGLELDRGKKVDIDPVAFAKELGIRYLDVSENAVSAIQEKNAESARRQWRGLRDAIKVFVANKRPFTAIAVNLARVGEIEPKEYLDKLKLVHEIVDRSTAVAMAGKSTFEKLQTLPEIRAIMIYVIDAVLADPSLTSAVTDLAKDPKIRQMVEDFMDSPKLEGAAAELMAHFGKISDAFGRLTE